jgi:hypothetical protein
MRISLTKIEDENYIKILSDFLDEHLEEFYFVYLDIIDNEGLEINLFKDHMTNLYLTDHQHYFEIIAKVISNNNLDNSNDFFLLTTYNFALKDWKIANDILSNDDKRVQDFLDIEPYTYLSNVDVFVLRSANTLCLVHNCTEFTSLEYYPIQSNNIEIQLSYLLQKIDNEFNWPYYGKSFN